MNMKKLPHRNLKANISVECTWTAKQDVSAIRNLKKKKSFFTFVTACSFVLYLSVQMSWEGEDQACFAVLAT